MYSHGLNQVLLPADAESKLQSSLFLIILLTTRLADRHIGYRSPPITWNEIDIVFGQFMQGEIRKIQMQRRPRLKDSSTFTKSIRQEVPAQKSRFPIRITTYRILCIIYLATRSSEAGTEFKLRVITYVCCWTQSLNLRQRHGCEDDVRKLQRALKRYISESGCSNSDGLAQYGVK